jgi:hypothetical protein
VLVLVACLVAAAAPAALANGDPASDVLPARDSYTPYTPKVPSRVQKALDRFLARARRDGYPIKVAVIGTPEDLGVVPGMFGKPQQYASFLGPEITFHDRPHLLVVMPAGYGTFGVHPHVAAAARSLAAPGSADGAVLGKAAIQGAVKVAAAAGHPLPPPKISGGSGGGSTPVLVFAVPALLVAAGALLAGRRARRRGHVET